MRSASLCESEWWPGPQTDVDIWHFHCGENQCGHKVTLRHSLTLNKYTLIIDGKVSKSESVAVLQRHFRINFLIDNFTAIIDCQGNAGVTWTFARSLEVGGVKVPSLRSLIVSSVGTEISGKNVPKIGQFPPVRVGITDYRSFMEEAKKAIVYQLFVELSFGGELVILERRFSEFLHLDCTIRSALGYPKKYFVESNLELPPKVFNPLVDQYTSDFLNTRKEALDIYLQRILANMDILMHVQEIYTFFGLHPLTGKPMVY